MKTHHVLPVLLVLSAAGCGNGSADRPLSTVDSDGTLTIPAGYQPAPATDLSRVDCAQYLVMTPAEMRSEIRTLCAASTTPEEQAKNPFCEAQRITEHCERSESAKRS